MVSSDSACGSPSGGARRTAWVAILGFGRSAKGMEEVVRANNERDMEGSDTSGG